MANTEDNYYFPRSTLAEILEWIEKHKIFTILLVILIILGFDRAARYFTGFLRSSKRNRERDKDKD